MSCVVVHLRLCLPHFCSKDCNGPDVFFIMSWYRKTFGLYSSDSPCPSGSVNSTMGPRRTPLDSPCPSGSVNSTMGPRPGWSLACILIPPDPCFPLAPPTLHSPLSLNLFLFWPFSCSMSPSRAPALPPQLNCIFTARECTFPGEGRTVTYISVLCFHYVLMSLLVQLSLVCFLVFWLISYSVRPCLF